MEVPSRPDANLPVLHIWPKTDHLHSLDPACVSTLLYLQLAIPEKFVVDYTHNPDLSPSGRSVLVQCVAFIESDYDSFC